MWGNPHSSAIACHFEMKNCEVNFLKKNPTTFQTLWVWLDTFSKLKTKCITFLRAEHNICVLLNSKVPNGNKLKLLLLPAMQCASPWVMKQQVLHQKRKLAFAAPSLLRMTPVVAGQTSMALAFRTTHINPKKKRNMFEGPKIIALPRGSSLVNCVDNGRYILVCDTRISFFR